jgi:hypothetical protein
MEVPTSQGASVPVLTLIMVGSTNVTMARMLGEGSWFSTLLNWIDSV